MLSSLTQTENTFCLATKTEQSTFGTHRRKRKLPRLRELTTGRYLTSLYYLKTINS